MTSEIDIKRIGPRNAIVLRTTTLFNVEIPKDFKTDGASVPRGFWWILSPFTEGIYAAIVHDFQLLEDGLNPKRRQKIDRMFYYNLRDSKISFPRCLIAYYAVRAWSWYYVKTKGKK